MTTTRRDLFVLAADATMVSVLRAFLTRPLHQMLACRPIVIDAQRDVLNDPLRRGDTDGALHRRAHEILKLYVDTHEHALVVLDRQFGGELAASRVHDDILANLNAFGWKDRAEVVVIDPELEVWLWQDNENVEKAVGHKGTTKLRDVLLASGDWPGDRAKPIDPKGTIQRVMRQNRAGSPAGVYPQIAARVSVKRCKDASFEHFKTTLERWFPPEGT